LKPLSMRPAATAVSGYPNLVAKRPARRIQAPQVVKSVSGTSRLVRVEAGLATFICAALFPAFAVNPQPVRALRIAITNADATNPDEHGTLAQRLQESWPPAAESLR